MGQFTCKLSWSIAKSIIIFKLTEIELRQQKRIKVNSIYYLLKIIQKF